MNFQYFYKILFKKAVLVCYNNLTKQDEIKDFYVSENIVSSIWAVALAASPLIALKHNEIVI